jgi:hypothetical protein
LGCWAEDRLIGRKGAEYEGEDEYDSGTKTI